MEICSTLFKLSLFLTGNNCNESVWGKELNTHGCHNSFVAANDSSRSRSFRRALFALAIAGGSFHANVIFNWRLLGGTVMLYALFPPFATLPPKCCAFVSSSMAL